MTFPINGKTKFVFQTTNQQKSIPSCCVACPPKPPTRDYLIIAVSWGFNWINPPGSVCGLAAPRGLDVLVTISRPFVGYEEIRRDRWYIYWHIYMCRSKIVSIDNMFLHMCASICRCVYIYFSKWGGPQNPAKLVTLTPLNFRHGLAFLRHHLRYHQWAWCPMSKKHEENEKPFFRSYD